VSAVGIRNDDLGQTLVAEGVENGGHPVVGNRTVSANHKNPVVPVAAEGLGESLLIDRKIADEERAGIVDRDLDGFLRGLIPGAGDQAPVSVRYAGGAYTIEFDGSAEGVPAGADVDAVTRDASGDLVLSFDTTVNVGVVADDEDLVRFDGSSFSLALDTSALAVSPAFDGALDVDGVDARPGGVFALSFDASGSAGGVVFDDEDVLSVDPAAPSVAMAFDASSVHAGWPAADLDAVMLPEPGAAAGLAAGGLLLARLSRRRRRR